MSLIQLFSDVDDRKLVSTFSENFIEKVFVDKGYISKKLTNSLALDDITLITKLKKI